ncbi:MAG: bacteriocin family protein [Candidatus Tectomicrobia bacterium]|uniref:Bacteriocin family protein n=1 Tax=Tectimicrobiota bacterium TaxID=2528274 RepID=A0A932FVV0_UNCTE|nr:bacteriocin family protein [Candidatus Tectomicrobia bacterium]
MDKAVTEAARRVLVGRRFIPITGPVGAGVQTVVQEVFLGAKLGSLDMIGEHNETLRPHARRHLPLPIIHKDFFIHWRDGESSQHFGIPLDTGPAASASVFCANAEDRLIFYGNEEMEYEGLTNAQKRTTVSRSDWATMGNGFKDVVAAIEKLIAAGQHGPYALALSPGLYTSLHREYGNTGLLEIEQIRRLATDGVYPSPMLDEPGAVLVSTGEQNMDLVIAQDLVITYLETFKMNYYLRVFEILALRIKRPEAICTIE